MQGMTAPVAGTAGVRLDLIIRQGSSFGAGVFKLQNPDLTPVLLSGFLFRGQMRKKALDTSVVATFDCSVVDAANGLWTFGMSLAKTTALTAGEQINSAASTYVYDIEMVDTLYRVLPIFYGNVQVQREVTR